jgi:tetratricopeptide (TPR) repeat protein
MPKVFLSHVRADRPQARRLAEALRRAGHVPWIAEDEARIGEPLAETLARGLRDTQAAVVLISRASVESAWTPLEVELLRAHGQGPLRQYVARLDRVTPSAELAQAPFIDLFPGETAWQSGVRRLLQWLEGERPSEPSAEPSALPPNNLPRRAAPFVGREQELAILHEHLVTGPHARRAVVCGPRGMGKTAFVTEYAARYAADYPGGIWWVPAWLGPRRALTWLCMSLSLHHPDAASLWASLGQHPLSAGSTALARHVSQALQSQPKPALLILDDLKSGTWQHYLMTGQTRVLVTTRAAAPTRLRPAFVQYLPPLSRRDAGELLKETRPLKKSSSQEAARDRVLQEWLRGSPLLVTLVARLRVRTRMPWDALEQALTQRASDGPSSAGLAARTRAVLDLCIDQFAPASLPRRLLGGASIFAHDLELGATLAWAAATGESAVPYALPKEAESALEMLDRSGLLLYDSPFCQVPGAISRRVKALTRPAAWAQLADRGLEATLEGISELEDHDSYEPWATEGDLLHLEAALRTAAPHAGSRAWFKAADFLAGRLSRRGDHLSAKVLRKRALRHAEQGVGPHMELINDLRADLAATYEALGNLRAAQRLLEQAVAGTTSNLHGVPERRAQHLEELSRLQHGNDLPAAALESIDRALEIDQKLLARRHPRFPTRLFLRARILQALRRDEEAHEALEEALAAGERLAKNSGLSLAPILEALAGTRRERGDEKGALALLTRVLDEDQRTLGEAHYETVFHLTELARTYAAFGRRPQTRATVERVLSLLDGALTPTDQRRGSLLSRLAESLLQVGEHEAALSLLDQALDVEAAKPAPDARHLSSLVTIWLMHGGRQHDAGADALLARVLSLTRRRPSRGRAAAARLSRLLVHLLHASEPVAPRAAPSSPLQIPSPGAGAESLERALRLLRKNKVRDEFKAEALREVLAAAQQGGDPANGARAQLLLADLEGRRGAWEQAYSSARQGLQLALRAEAPCLVAEGYRLLGDAALHGSLYEEARMSYEEAIHRYDSLGEHRRAAQTRALLVTLLLQLGRPDGIEAHVRWFEAHQQHPALTEEERNELREVLALVNRRLSARAPGARHQGS